MYIAHFWQRFRVGDVTPLIPNCLDKKFLAFGNSAFDSSAHPWISTAQELQGPLLHQLAMAHEVP